MDDIKHPAAETLDDKRTYAADVDLSRKTAEQKRPKAQSRP